VTKYYLFLALSFGNVSCTDVKEEPSSGLELEHVNPNMVSMSGFLRSTRRESINPPAGQDWSFKILFLIPDGQRVKAGDVVARLEGEQVQKNLREAETNLLKAEVDAQAKLSEVKSDIENLEISTSEKEKELAVLKAGSSDGSSTSEWVISGRDRLIEELDTEAKLIDLKLAREKLGRKKSLLGKVEEANASKIMRFKTKVESLKAEIKAGELTAPAAGVAIHKLAAWRRQKPQVGGMTYRGTTLIEIVDDSSLTVEGYLTEAAWSRVKVGQSVQVTILGKRETTVAGQVTSISRIVMKARDWDRSLPEQHVMFDVPSFKVGIKVPVMPPEAKPDGEVKIVVLDEVPVGNQVSREGAPHAG